MDQLDEALRDAVILYYFRDMPLKKIAELLETSEGAVKNRLYRARHILAKRLDIDTESTAVICQEGDLRNWKII